MSYNSKSFSSPGTVYHRIYSDMAGVDFSGDGSGIGKNRFAYLENMWRDWNGEGATVTESIPGFRKLKSFAGAIRGLFIQKTSAGEFLLVHAGEKLFRAPMASRDDPAAYTEIADVADTDSRGFSSGEDFYLLDGTHVTKVSAAGVASAVGDAGTVKPYVPTTYKNGEPFEQRNLFSNRFRETTRIGTKALFASGTPGLSYGEDTVAGDGSLILLGRGTAAQTEILVPAYVKVGNDFRRVTKVAEHAFLADPTLQSVIFADGGVETVGAHAFERCPNLEFAALGDSVKTVGEYAFADGNTLDLVYLGAAISSFDSTAVDGCPVFTDIYYAGTEREFNEFDTDSYFINRYDVTFETRYAYDYLTVPVHSAAGAVTSFTLDGVSPTVTVRAENGLCTEVVAKISKTAGLLNAEAVVEGTLAAPEGDGQDFFSRYGTADGVGAIEKCRIAETFDGRIFLSGNPDYPGAVFYSSRDAGGGNCPTYFGIYNYFQDGVGHVGVLDMLSVGQTLAVFKTADDGGGSIFYHTPKETDSDLVPKIYPVTYVHTGLCAEAGAISFFDDAVFLSEEGVSALESTSLTGEKRLAVRSHNVSEKLLAENLSEARLAVFAGYLVVSVGGRMYLADSRRVFTHGTGNREYEWYYLSGIGTYSSDSRVFRYSSVAGEGYAVNGKTDVPVEPEAVVYSEEDAGGVMRYFVLRGSDKIAVDPTEEYRGGTFSPATAVLGDGDLLFFGTATGSLCLFNTDKRGVPPARIAGEAGFDAAHYAETYGRRIHPDFYDFDRHAPRYAVKTVKDNCGAPHLTKDTVRHSLTVKCRTYASTSLRAEVGTEKAGFRTLEATVGTVFSFWDLDFSALSLDGADYLTVPLPEKEKRWVEKQISLSSEEFRSPIGISNLAYRYTVGGRIKTF